MRKIVAIAVGAAGVFGFFSIRLFEFSPSPTMRWLIIAGIVLFLVLFGLFEWQRGHEPDPGLTHYLRNPIRRKRKPWTAMGKILQVEVPSKGGQRRDAVLKVELDLLNRSKRTIGHLEFPLGGDALAHAQDLAVTAEVDGQTVNAEVRNEEGYSPVVVLPLPAPGLPGGGKARVVVQWQWPGMVRMKGGPWVLGLKDVHIGSEARLRVDYPKNHPQHAQARLIRAFGPLEWSRMQGSVTPVETSNGWRFEYALHRSRFDSYLGLEMEAR